ncbi:MAG: hypothetical protein GDA55_02320 [Cellvibrionales bacterium]|nr:hypothetical protein [Cellvibrionales bacterium]
MKTTTNAAIIALAGLATLSADFLPKINSAIRDHSLNLAYRLQVPNARGDKIEAAPNDPLLVTSPGVFTHSRRAAPFGINGPHYATTLTYHF